jgi:hypothetical protein
VELYARVRRAVQVEGKSERQMALEYGLARETVRVFDPARLSMRCYRRETE